jgi:hypothetical protein
MVARHGIKHTSKEFALLIQHSLGWYRHDGHTRWPNTEMEVCSFIFYRLMSGDLSIIVDCPIIIIQDSYIQLPIKQQLFFLILFQDLVGSSLICQF